jgi:hypothetical protein
MWSEMKFVHNSNDNCFFNFIIIILIDWYQSIVNAKAPLIRKARSFADSSPPFLYTMTPKKLWRNSECAYCDLAVSVFCRVGELPCWSFAVFGNCRNDLSPCWFLACYRRNVLWGFAYTAGYILHIYLACRRKSVQGGINICRLGYFTN